MAIALLIHTNQVFPEFAKEYGFIGELSLTGELRGCTGVLPMIVAAKDNGIKKIIVPKDNIEEASLIEGVQAFGFESLKEVVRYIEKKNTLAPSVAHVKVEEQPEHPLDVKHPHTRDFSRELGCFFLFLCFTNTMT
jgi:magnesium chelatase family protein